MNITSRNFWFMVIVMWGFWLAITGSFRWEAMVLGAAVCFLVALFNRELLITSGESPPLTVKNVLWGLYLIKDLLISVIIANFQVAAVVLNPRMPIYPGVVRFKAGLEKPVSMVILANAITLTPGTLTVFCDDNEVLVHALTEKSAEEVTGWKLIEELQEMEG